MLLLLLFAFWFRLLIWWLDDDVVMMVDPGADEVDGGAFTEVELMVVVLGVVVVVRSVGPPSWRKT